MIKQMFIIFVLILGLVGVAFAAPVPTQESVSVTPAAQSASAVAPAPVNDKSAVWFNLIFTVVAISAMMGYIGYVLEAQLGNK